MCFKSSGELKKYRAKSTTVGHREVSEVKYPLEPQAREKGGDPTLVHSEAPGSGHLLAFVISFDFYLLIATLKSKKPNHKHPKARYVKTGHRDNEGNLWVGTDKGVLNRDQLKCQGQRQPSCERGSYLIALLTWPAEGLTLGEDAPFLWPRN